MLRVGLDVGGHTITGGAAEFSQEGAKLLSVRTLPAPSPRTAQNLIEALASLVAALCGKEHEIFVGMGLPGFVAKDRKTVARLTNYDNCDGLAISDALERQLSAIGFDAKCTTENDANCAALGEGIAGAALGMEYYVVLTLGTGIGAGIVSSGQLLRGAHGMAAECGHMALCGTEFSHCGCSGAGHLEEAASADWIEKRAKAEGLPPDFKELWHMRHVPKAEAILSPALETLARGIVSLVVTLDPEAVILSGGMSRADGLAKELESRAQKYLPEPFRPYFKLKTSALGGKAAVIGAASLFLK